VFVGNLPLWSKGADLWQWMSDFGQIKRVWKSNRGRFGFCQYEDSNSAANAVAQTQLRKEKEGIVLRLAWANDNIEAPDLFCDLDGVLCDFVKRATELLGKSPDDLRDADPKIKAWMWETLKKAPGGFYNSLPWMPGGEQLWNAISHLKPTILTGCPRGDWAPAQKREWVTTNLGNDIKVITCMAVKKATFCRNRQSVLIDDSDWIKHGWDNKQGCFVHHCDVKNTLKELAELGVLPPAHGRKTSSRTIDRSFREDRKRSHASSVAARGFSFRKYDADRRQHSWRGRLRGDAPRGPRT